MCNQETENIKKTLQYFFEGLDLMDTELINQAFHPSAHLIEMSPVGFRDTPVTRWYDNLRVMKENADHPFNKEKSQKNIVYIDISGTAASAKVEWVFSNFKFYDYYNLLKIEDRWYIVNKIWSTEFFK